GPRVRSALPSRVLRGTRSSDRKEAKDAVAYLRAVVNPADEVSIKRIINEPKRGVGSTSIGELDAYATAHGLALPPPPPPPPPLPRRPAPGRRCRGRGAGRVGDRDLPRPAGRRVGPGHRQPRAAPAADAGTLRLPRPTGVRAHHRVRGAAG